MFGATLASVDANDAPFQVLAEALPELNSDSWRVAADGRMETTYRLRPNLTWHDGQPLTADDFAFAWQVYATPQFGQSGAETTSMMQEVVAPDSLTVLIRWRGAYAEAGVLEAVVASGVPTGGPTFTPLPRHILGRVYDEQRDVFLSHSYWTVDYIGAGPYRVDRWESGAFLEGAAFAGHALGRPKIDRVKMVWNSDASAVLANLLSGEVHVPIDESSRIAEGQVLQREWSGRNAGTVRFIPKNWRRIDFQSRPEYANPRAGLDDRVRKALAHSVDKQAINDGLLEGVGIPTDSMMYPTFRYAADLDREVAKYPLDTRRTETLMQEAGYRKAGDGFFESPGEGRLGFQVKGTASAQNAAERTILASGWRQAGFDVEEATFSPAEAQDGQTVSTFRSLYTTGAPAGTQAFGLFTTRTIARPETRWVGSNRSGWSNADYDRFAEAVQSTLEPAERGRQIIQAVKVLTETPAMISLYFNPSVLAFPTTVKGFNIRAADADQTWNVHEWEIS
jgi:peptide/nickel transport system substrate-binding protein